ncbi:MAG TPA: UDP-N-acetylmuramoyl-tripeptide--D-alanyl-D-alanine ligase [Candidatus Humimicrobiaceae bacterium]
MESILINEILNWTGAKLLLGKKESRITSFSTDSRTIARNDFFVPITGENYDGADYIAEAVRKGASGFVYGKNQKNINDVLKLIKNDYPGVTSLESGNTLDFFKEASKGYLKQFNVISLGITGSAGKTTTKNFIVRILEKTAGTVFSPKNFNNEIGIPKTIFEVNKNTKYLVVELGMRAKGQIADLAQICNLKYGIITGIGPSHLEFFKNVEEIALAKAEIGEMIYKNNGILFLNGDDKYTGLIEKTIKCVSVQCGLGFDFKYNFSNCRCDRNAVYDFDLNRLDKNILHINLNIPGYHNIYNSVLAAGLSLHLGIEPLIIKNSINETMPESLRMEIIEKSGKVILNDCYNANPLSVKSAIDSLAVISEKRKMRSIAILGDMLELGIETEKLHEEIGSYLSEKNIDILIAFGKIAVNIFNKFENSKKNKIKGYYFEKKEKMLNEIGKIIKPGDAVLIKGSRANKMENIIDYI